MRGGGGGGAEGEAGAAAAVEEEEEKCKNFRRSTVTQNEGTPTQTFFSPCSIQKIKKKTKMPVVAAFTPESAALGGLTLGAGKKNA